jgi:hypothetical protein
MISGKSTISMKVQDFVCGGCLGTIVKVPARSIKVESRAMRCGQRRGRRCIREDLMDEERVRERAGRFVHGFEEVFARSGRKREIVGSIKVIVEEDVTRRQNGKTIRSDGIDTKTFIVGEVSVEKFIQR